MPNINTQPKASGSVISQVVERIRTSDNVLVALSKDPSVDELSAALGLTFLLDKIGKHVTAIFSGAVPNAIEFLEPEKTFETNTNSLQDFIIALDKEKADHLRYKIDGDYVKVFITPYKTTIDEKDMEFSHGDYNVDLVIALNVASSNDLDSALTEYGRIMHDASSINISASVPGKFGDIEWGDPSASSVSEMIFDLSQQMKEKDKDYLDKPVATALLAGIVSATNRFSNEHTSPQTMAVASRLMTAGADQQLISSSIPVDILTTDVVDATEDAKNVKDELTSDENRPITGGEVNVESAKPMDLTNLDIQHDDTSSNDKSDGGNDEQDNNVLPVKSDSKERVDSANNEPVLVMNPANDAPEEESKDELADTTKATEQEIPTVVLEPAPLESKAPDLKPVTAPPAEPEPEPAPEPIEMPIPAPAPQPEPTPEPIEPVVEPPVIPIAPAEPEPQITLAADEPLVVDDEQAKATAELEQLVSSPQPSGVVDESTMKELLATSNNNSGNDETPKDTFNPPKAPKDYASMMESELSDSPVLPPQDSIAPVEDEALKAPELPSEKLADDNSMEQLQVHEDDALEEKPSVGEVVNNEYVDPLPMPDPDSILPPPPIPFNPENAPINVADAPDPSAQDYAKQIQDGVSFDTQGTVDESISPTISMPSVSEQVVGGGGAISAPAHTGGVMPDQVYPADPSAFQIPELKS